MKRQRADERSLGNGPRVASGWHYAAVTQLEGEERSIRVAARRERVLPFIAMNADAGDPAWDTPALELRRRSERETPGRGVRRAEAFVSFTAVHKRSSFPGGLGPSAPGREDEEVCI
ncbi:MAG: hypothetical protein OXG98_18995 [Gemmatimonadetes bacterium]|nr:hypothetical protein [Gemmatimonadota bacterium]